MHRSVLKEDSEYRVIGFISTDLPPTEKFKSISVEVTWFVQSKFVVVAVLFVPYFPSHPLLASPSSNSPRLMMDQTGVRSTGLGSLHEPLIF
jgi:hypothetical protein